MSSLRYKTHCTSRRLVSLSYSPRVSYKRPITNMLRHFHSHFSTELNIRKGPSWLRRWASRFQTLQRQQRSVSWCYLTILTLMWTRTDYFHLRCRSQGLADLGTGRSHCHQSLWLCAWRMFRRYRSCPCCCCKRNILVRWHPRPRRRLKISLWAEAEMKGCFAVASLQFWQLRWWRLRMRTLRGLPMFG